MFRGSNFRICKPPTAHASPAPCTYLRCRLRVAFTRPEEAALPLPRLARRCPAPATPALRGNAWARGESTTRLPPGLGLSLPRLLAVPTLFPRPLPRTRRRPRLLWLLACPERVLASSSTVSNEGPPSVAAPTSEPPEPTPCFSSCCRCFLSRRWLSRIDCRASFMDMVFTRRGWS